jgi:hypothetical protein
MLMMWQVVKKGNTTQTRIMLEKIKNKNKNIIYNNAVMYINKNKDVLSVSKRDPVTSGSVSQTIVIRYKEIRDIVYETSKK